MLIEVLKSPPKSHFPIRRFPRIIIITGSLIHWRKPIRHPQSCGIVRQNRINASHSATQFLLCSKIRRRKIRAVYGEHIQMQVCPHSGLAIKRTFYIVCLISDHFANPNNEVAQPLGRRPMIANSVIGGFSGEWSCTALQATSKTVHFNGHARRVTQHSLWSTSRRRTFGPHYVHASLISAARCLPHGDRAR